VLECRCGRAPLRRDAGGDLPPPEGTDDAAGLTVLLDARCAEPGEAIPDYAPTPAAD